MVTKISLAILDELYRENPGLLLYVNGCETMEEVHNSMKETREFLFYCDMFHDAGKLYFLDTINLFARALFNEEFDLIRLHPQMAMSSSANGIPQNHTPRRHSTTISGTTKKAAIRASIPIKATTTPFSTRSSSVPIVSVRQPIPSGG